MDPNKLTQKSQEALHDAQTKALRFGHTELTPEHLLLALLDQNQGLVPRLLQRMEVDPAGLHRDLERHLEGRPRVSGSGAIRGAGSAILVDLVPVTSPYEIAAIGDVDAIRRSVTSSTAASHLSLLRDRYLVDVRAITTVRGLPFGAEQLSQDLLEHVIDVEAHA